MSREAEHVEPERGAFDTQVARCLDLVSLPDFESDTVVDGTVQDVAVHGGFVQVAGNKVSVLSDVAELAGALDRMGTSIHLAMERLRSGNSPGS